MSYPEWLEMMEAIKFHRNRLYKYLKAKYDKTYSEGAYDRLAKICKEQTGTFPIDKHIADSMPSISLKESL